MKRDTREFLIPAHLRPEQGREPRDSDRPLPPSIPPPLEREAKRIGLFLPILTGSIMLLSAGFSMGTYLTSRKLEPIIAALQDNKDSHNLIDSRLRALEMTMAGIQGQVNTISSVLGTMPTSDILTMKSMHAAVTYGGGSKDPPK